MRPWCISTYWYTLSREHVRLRYCPLTVLCWCPIVPLFLWYFPIWEATLLIILLPYQLTPWIVVGAFTLDHKPYDQRQFLHLHLKPLFLTIFFIFHQFLKFFKIKLILLNPLTPRCAEFSRWLQCRTIYRKKMKKDRKLHILPFLGSLFRMAQSGFSKNDETFKISLTILEFFSRKQLL